jgi:hypothetical protein
MKKALAISIGLVAAHFILREMRRRNPTINYVDQVPFNYNAITVPPFGIYIDKRHQANAALLKNRVWRFHRAIYPRTA